MTTPAHAHLAGTAALLLLVATVQATTIGSGFSSEADALLAWKASLVDTAALSSWTKATPVCSWYGVTCNAEHVDSLRLDRLGLSGRLGLLDIATLPGLTALSLRSNNLVGDIPASISRLDSLIILDLSSNGLNGSIPPQLGDIQSLVYLMLSNNCLVGDIPHQLCGFQHLELMDLSNNQLTGNLLDCLCDLPVLNFMGLSENRLIGGLSNCWWNLHNLRYLDLSNNSFSGEISATRAGDNYCNLRSLYLTGNGFTGSFPSILQGCSFLATLDFRNNRFSGAIPSWIGSALPVLRILSLRSNNFTGEIPSELSQLSNLQLLDMANNSLTGSIPVAFGNLTYMSNPKGWMIPREPEYPDRIDVIWKGQPLVFESTSWLLNGIDLSSNSLSQCIPEELTNLQGLMFLNLSRNHLSCGIPENIGSLNSLEALDLSSNELSGAIPPSITHITGLSALNVSMNHLSGKIPLGSQTQTLTDPSIYSGNSGLCGFPLDIVCTDTLPTPDEKDAPDDRNDEGEDQWLYYSVIAGTVIGIWLWFGMFFICETWRRCFHFFVDDIQRKIMLKMSH